MPKIGSIATRCVLAVSFLPLSVPTSPQLNMGIVTKSAMTRPNWTDEKVNAEMIATTPWNEWGNTTDVAKGAVFLASDDAAWVTGIGLPVDGGYLAQ